jgi:two-component system chemotaxis response regulator CheY
VLTDINMAHMDGYEFIRRVRAEAQYEDLPIIIVSTEGESSDRMKGFEAGANLYLVKPSEPAVMIENIRLVLSAA